MKIITVGSWSECVCLCLLVRYWGAMGLCILLLVITLCFTLGVVFGCCGRRPDEASSCHKSTGASWLMWWVGGRRGSNWSFKELNFAHLKVWNTEYSLVMSCIGCNILLTSVDMNHKKMLLLHRNLIPGHFQLFINRKYISFLLCKLSIYISLIINILLPLSCRSLWD